jgi:hypothetical protein
VQAGLEGELAELQIELAAGGRQAVGATAGPRLLGGALGEVMERAASAGGG